MKGFVCLLEFYKFVTKCKLHALWVTLSTYIMCTLTVFEIKDLFGAPIGCMGRETHAPGSISMGSFLYKHVEDLERACTCRVHSF